MSRYKVLGVPSWLVNDRLGRATSHYTEITPVFNRDGEYYDRLDKTWWIEYNGKAWTQADCIKYFLWRIKAFSGVLLSSTEIKFLQRVMKTAPSKKMRRDIQKILADSNATSMVLLMGGDMRDRLSGLRHKKRFKKFMEERKCPNS